MNRLLDAPLDVQPDGLFTHRIKRHSLEKIRLHNYYARLFSTSMKNQWAQRAYVGLYAGPGRAEIQPGGQLVETSAMSVFRLPDPFTKYIFVDKDKRCIDALEQRVRTLPGTFDVTLISKDARDALPEINAAMPRFSKGNKLLSFCFVDPFAADLDFEVIRSLGSQYLMDFLVLLMLGRDVRTNFDKYFREPSDTRIAALIDDPNWREDWESRRQPLDGLIAYLLEKFDAAMIRLGYKPAAPSDAHPVRVTGKGVFMYSLVFYSKHDLGRRFWRTARAGTTPQLNLGFDM